MRNDTIYISNEALIPTISADVKAGNTVTLRLFGNSMLPFLHDGRDKALLASPQTPRVGEPVLAEIAPHRYVLHRVIGINGDRMTLLGDGNLSVEKCHTGDVIASVIGFYRKGSTKLDRIDGTKWRVYSAVWMKLRPMRRYLLGIYRRIVLGQWRRRQRRNGSSV